MAKDYKKDRYLGRIHGKSGVTIVNKNTISMANIKADKGCNTLIVPNIADFDDGEVRGYIIKMDHQYQAPLERIYGITFIMIIKLYLL